MCLNSATIKTLQFRDSDNNWLREWTKLNKKKIEVPMSYKKRKWNGHGWKRDWKKGWYANMAKNTMFV